MTGVDAGEGNIVVATAHAQHDPNLMGLHYHCQTVEDHEAYLRAEAEGAENEASLLYDGVVASEVIEHVDDPEYFVEICCRLVKVRAMTVFFFCIFFFAKIFVK